MLRRIRKRIIGAVLIAAMLITTLPTVAFAGTSKVVTSGLSTQQTLNNGYIYRVTSNTTLNASAGKSALYVANNATVVIDIAPGCVLTVNGGNGSASSGGGAGINLPSTSVLVITGGGVLRANGGSSGRASSGSGGDSAGSQWSYSPAGGYGGYGAGGAGAGIGGNGGNGGSGGSGGGYSYQSSPRDYKSGRSGSSGSSGSSGGAMGSLYVLGTVSVTANGGGATSAAYGGGAGSAGENQHDSKWWIGRTGGAGGGGGGGTNNAYAIGSGSGGGGGGGGGGSGAIYNGPNGYSYFVGASGGGGGGGYGYAGSASYCNVSTGSPYKYGGNSGYTGGDISGGSGGGGLSYYCSFDSRAYSYGSGGGNGGSRGGYNSIGTVYRASTASVNGRTANAIVDSHSAVTSTISFDQQSGSGGTNDQSVNYGGTMANITIPVREQHTFGGYYTSPNGGGTRYFDHRGMPLVTYYNTENITLYAYWVASAWNITFNKQGGAGGTDNAVTTGTDGTLPNVTAPSREHYIFEGYYTQASGAGTQYYDASGTAHGKLTANTTLFAKWRQNQYNISFSKEGGSGGTVSIYSEAEGGLPAIELPTRVGYSFEGYYTAAAGGEQYYDADGVAVSGKKVGGAITLYAHWKVGTYTITYKGLEDAQIDEKKPTSRSYMAACTIPDPVKTVIENGESVEYTFLGWQIDGSEQLYKGLTFVPQAPKYAKDLTLNAVWVKYRQTDVTTETDVTGVSNSDEVKKQLEMVFQTIVVADNSGVTMGDLNGTDVVKIELKVSEDKNAENQGKIEGIAQGSALTYYDMTAVKSVTTGVNTTTTMLEEIPSYIEVAIPVTGDLKDQTAYNVYRVHGGKAEKISADTGTNSEYYMVETVNGQQCIVIRTRKFSTYAISGSSLAYVPGDGQFNNGAYSDAGGFDVQGRVIEGNKDLVYKIDISWGSMKYEFVTSQTWDPETHLYSEGGFNGWAASGFDGVNNKLSSMNHSNGSVVMNYAVTENNLTGTTMTLHLYNDVLQAEANSFVLPAAPEGSADADLDTFDAFLFLEGAPENDWLTNLTSQEYQKVGTILVTVSPQEN